MKKFIANLLSVALVIAVISVPPAAASVPAAAASSAPDYLVLDCSKATNIESRKFTVEKTIVKSAPLSAKWEVANLRSPSFAVPTDLTIYNNITFWVYGNAKNPVTMLVRFLSNDPGTDGDDYYFVEKIKVDKDGWQRISLPLKDFKTSRTPLGWNHIQGLTIFTEGWTMPKDIDPSTVLYLDNIVLSASEPEPTPTPEISATPAPTPVTEIFGDSIALLVDSPNAYAKKALTKVDPANPDVAPVVVNDRTLVPVRFISESFGAAVNWDEAAQRVDIDLSGRKISLVIGSNELNVDGKVTQLDVPAQTIHDRTMIPLRAMSEAVGKEVFWDDRGLILITEKKLDAVADSRVVDTLLGLLRTGKLTTAYNPAPRLTSEVLEAAFAQKPVFFNTSSNPGYGSAENYGSLALFYLSLAAYYDPDTKSASGVLAKDRALEHIRNLISGGREPMCANGPYWAHAAITSALTMARHTPAVWNGLTAEEAAKVDLIMKSLAISVNWGFNDANNYDTGLDMKGNFNKDWNPNYRCSYIPGILNAVIYFGGADKVNEIFTSFDYDAYMKELEAADYTNIIKAWSAAGKKLMEQGGDAHLASADYASASGAPAGTGKGVKMPFVYKGMELSNIDGIFEHLAKYTYGAKVTSIGGTKGNEDYAYIIDGTTSPFEGQDGMMLEFASGDANGIRSDAHYCYSSFTIVSAFQTVLRVLNGWDGSTPLQQGVDNLIYVGNEDLIYKLIHGYHSWSKGEAHDYFEYSVTSSGYLIAKELWRKVINFAGEPTTAIANPNAPADTPKPSLAPSAPPKDGITKVPDGAFTASQYEGTFTKDGIYSFGKAYKGKIKAEFDLTFAPDTDDAMNVVIALAEQGAESLKYPEINMMLQCYNGTINVRSGSSYINSAMSVSPNYRYHVRWEGDLGKKKYSVWLTPIYPEAKAETQIAKDYDFRTGARDISDIGVLAITRESENGDVWIENLTVNGDAIKK